MTRSHRRREPLEHVLVAGDLDDLDAITAVLVCLPDRTYGQVLVETAADAALPTLGAPPRVTVTRVVRTATGARGDALAAAVAGWAAEWIPDEPEPDRVVSIWLGASVRDQVDALGAPLERL